MTTWDELKVILERLRSLEPRPVVSYPDPRSDHGRRPPFQIRLRAWAGDTAKDLHERFGADVRLTLGAMTYPVASPTRSGAVEGADGIEDLSETEFRVELDGPLIVRSGYDTPHQLLITNLTGTRYTLTNKGPLRPRVADLVSGEIVGGSAGGASVGMVRVNLEPGKPESVGLLVRTASYLPELGYAVPAGPWAIQTVLRIRSGEVIRMLRTPTLPITVTD